MNPGAERLLRMSEIEIHHNHLPYAELLDRRPLGDIDLIVVHCTELPDLETARAFGERVLYPRTGTGNSGHFYIDRNGHAQQWVPLDRVAHHVRGHNRRSIGIELVNRGRYPDWLHTASQQPTEPYPADQIEALIALLDDLRHRLESLRWIAGHEDLDLEEVPASDQPERRVRRKRDPGPLFPWDQVLSRVSLSPLNHTGRQS